METAASIGTELALSGISRVIKKLASNLGGDVTADEMEHLDVFVGYQIEALIREAKSDDLLKSKPLLDKLQAAALELEDLLDLYEYNQIDKQVSSSSSSSNPIKKFISKSKQKLGTILPKSPLRTCLENLLKLVEQVKKNHPFIMSRKDTTRPEANTVTPKTSTLSSPFYGRGDQCNMIIKLLLDESQADLNSRTKNVQIIAIRGLGGAGKTTTAQHLYNENKIINYFDLRMWLHVTRGFDERRLIKEIIESAEKNACPQISNLDVLQTKLKDSISMKKFLLILDDVWEEDTSRLDILFSPLTQVGVKGSKIIVTTRTKKAAKNLNAKPIILLDELNDEDCWSILKHYAFDDNEEIIEVRQELKYVGSQIISKVKHSPLALKVVGSSLRNKRRANEWNKIFQREDILKDTMNLLLFSYQCLPLHLQRCFAYCSLFPKGYKFKIDVCWDEPHLISLWIAQGFVESIEESTLEKVGRNYIEELLSYSFFEENSNGYFIIHDLLHNIAEKVSNKQCYRIEHHNSLLVPTTCIHLSLCITGNLISIDRSTILALFDMFDLRSLRSLIILRCPDHVSIFENEKDIFQILLKLRALYIGGQQMKVLSDPRIDKLRHLRYLHVRYNNKLLVSLVKLYQLQFFILTTDLEYGTTHLPANTLPQDFSNFTNLRTLRFYNKFGGEELDYLYYNSRMVNIEKLPLLQNLKKFHVDGFNGMKSLRDLQIGGSFSILNLENVKSKEEATQAMLNKKKNIDKLIFVWGNTPGSISTCEKVLEGLEPHSNLEGLEIKGYQGDKLPKWMVKENWLPCLQSLRLEFCTSLKIVQFLPPRLQVLEVENCHELMQLPPLSDTLLKLELIRCPKLQTLTNLSPTVTDLRLESCSFKIVLFLPRLQYLYVRDCDEFIRLPPPLNDTLLTLWLIRCPKLRTLTNLSRSITDLRLVSCTSLKIVRFLPPRLQYLDVRDCNELIRLPPLSDTLLTLWLIRCPKLQAFTNLSPTVTSLNIEDCPNLMLPSKSGNSFILFDLSVFTNLKSLWLKGFPHLLALTNLSPTVTRLTVEDCPKLRVTSKFDLEDLEFDSVLEADDEPWIGCISCRRRQCQTPGICWPGYM